MVHSRPAAVLVTLLLGSAALGGCGGGGEVTLPTALPSVSLERPTPSLTPPTPTRSPEVPTPTRTETPEPTAEPTSEEPTPEPTPEPTAEPTSEAPEESPTPTGTLSQNATSIPPSEPGATETESKTPEPTQTDNAQPTQTQSTGPTATESEAPSASETASESPTASASPTESASPTATGSASASATADDSGSSQLPLWLGLGALLAAGVALIWFLVARSKGKDWDERMEVERAQGRWVVTELVPALTNPATPAQMVGPHWTTAQPTLDELEANLAALITDAPDEARAAQARAIGAALTQVRSSAATHVALVAGGTADPTTVATSAAAVQTARAQLEAALGNTP
jgi:hypothetical protein